MGLIRVQSGLPGRLPADRESRLHFTAPFHEAPHLVLIIPSDGRGQLKRAVPGPESLLSRETRCRDGASPEARASVAGSPDLLWRFPGEESFRFVADQDSQKVSLGGGDQHVGRVSAVHSVD